LVNFLKKKIYPTPPAQTKKIAPPNKYTKKKKKKKKKKKIERGPGSKGQVKAKIKL